MLAWLCWFNPCRWTPLEGHLWQCERCKTVSLGRDVAGWHHENHTRPVFDNRIDHDPWGI